MLQSYEKKCNFAFENDKEYEENRFFCVLAGGCARFRGVQVSRAV